MEDTLYLFKSEFDIRAYQGEDLVLYVGDVAVKTFRNPSREILAIFGYKPLQHTVRPPEEPGFAIEMYYENLDTVIKECYRYVEKEESESN